jgi:hypothetical protein
MGGWVVWPQRPLAGAVGAARDPSSGRAGGGCRQQCGAAGGGAGCQVEAQRRRPTMRCRCCRQGMPLGSTGSPWGLRLRGRRTSRRAGCSVRWRSWQQLTTQQAPAAPWPLPHAPSPAPAARVALHEGDGVHQALVARGHADDSLQLLRALGGVGVPRQLPLLAAGRLRGCAGGRMAGAPSSGVSTSTSTVGQACWRLPTSRGQRRGQQRARRACPWRRASPACVSATMVLSHTVVPSMSVSDLSTGRSRAWCGGRSSRST